MAKVVLFGNGKIAEVVHEYLARDSEHEVVAFTCDQAFIGGPHYRGLPLLPFETIEKHYPPGDYRMFIAVGYHELNRLRARIYESAKSKGYRLISYVSSRSWPGRELATGDNCLILDGVSVQPGAHIGNNVALWSGVIIGHHASIGDHCWLASGTAVGGGTGIEPYCFTGLNATVGHEITVGASSLLGGGSLVTKTLPPESVLVAGDTERLRLDSRRFLMISKLK